jgi:hypothetical protein
MKRSESKMKSICIVCGYDGLFEPPYDSDGICPCCSFHYGFDDDIEAGLDRSKTYITWREEWINKSYPWFSTGRRPPHNWNGRNQLERFLHEK